MPKKYRKKQNTLKKIQRGSIGSFFVFGMLALLIFAALVSVGGIPQRLHSNSGEQILPVTLTPGANPNNTGKTQQMETFLYITLTPTPTPPPSDQSPSIGANVVADCSKSGLSTATLSGKTFSGGLYNGNGQTLSGGVYTVKSNTCIENYKINNSVFNVSGASNITIVNNTWNGTPQGKQAIGGISGNNIAINYNTIKTSSSCLGGAIYGRGSMSNVTIANNDIEAPGKCDGIHLQFNNGSSGSSNNVYIGYNKIPNNGYFPIELQMVVHGLTVEYNYSTIAPNVQNGGQFSISVSNEVENSGGYITNDSSTKGVMQYNVIYGLGRGDCFENKGTGLSYFHNWCYNYPHFDDFTMLNTGPAANNVPSVISNNVLLSPNPGSGSMSEYEGFQSINLPYMKPTESNNIWAALNTAQSTNPPPAWNYKVGAQ